MAEVRFDRLDHRQPLPQATVRQVGSGWDSPTRTTRDDPVTHLPLHNLPPAPSPQPRVVSPPAPTETQLRDVLEQAKASRDFTHAEVDRAAATHGRAIALVEHCTARLASYDGLDDQITEATVAALRSDSGRPDLDATLRQRQAERDIARADTAAAARAEQVLAAALADAKADAEKAATSARKAAASVLAIEATAPAERHEALLAEAVGLRERLAQFDRAVTGSGATIPPTVFGVLRDPANGVNLLRNISAGEWSAKLDALLLDTAPHLTPTED